MKRNKNSKDLYLPLPYTFTMCCRTLLRTEYNTQDRIVCGHFVVEYFFFQLKLQKFFLDNSTETYNGKWNSNDGFKVTTKNMKP